MSTASDELETFYQFANTMREAEEEGFSLERAYQAYRNQQWQPRTPLAQKLKLLRAQHLADGGTFQELTPDELDAEVAERRGSLGN